MSKHGLIRPAFPILMLLTGGTTVQAAVVLFSDLGTGGNVYNALSGATINGSTSSAASVGYYTQGYAFSPSSTGVVGKIDAAFRVG